MADPISRRDFVKSGSAATAAFLSTVPLVHASGQETTIKIGLVGCGGRGSGAAENCLASSPNVQLVALGDMFPDRIKGSQRTLSKLEGYKVTDEMVFTGWDAYKKVVDSPVDLVLFATPPGFHTGGGGRGPFSYLGGLRSRSEFRNWSHLMICPVWAASRPMIAVSVLNATCSASLSGFPFRMLAIRSVCSWT